MDIGEQLAVRGLEQWPDAARRLASLPPDAQLPVAGVACAAAESWVAELVRVADDELWLLEPWLTDAEVRAGAFVLRRDR